MPDLHLITVGKLKNKHLKSVENDYLKRISTINLKIHELKSQSEDLIKEENLIFKKIESLKLASNSKIILLTEYGKIFESPDFSHFLFKQFEQSSTLIFIIGGAAGFTKEIKKKASSKVSLSSLTFPHQFARIIFIEQVYRAETIFKNHPYHK